MPGSKFVEFNDLTSEAESAWFKLWKEALKSKFQAQQKLFMDTWVPKPTSLSSKPITSIGNLFHESLEVNDRNISPQIQFPILGVW